MVCVSANSVQKEGCELNQEPIFPQMELVAPTGGAVPSWSRAARPLIATVVLIALATHMVSTLCTKNPLSL